MIDGLKPIPQGLALAISHAIGKLKESTLFAVKTHIIHYQGLEELDIRFSAFSGETLPHMARDMFPFIFKGRVKIPGAPEKVFTEHCFYSVEAFLQWISEEDAIADCCYKLLNLEI